MSMVKIRVLKEFKDLKAKKWIKPGTEMEIEVARANKLVSKKAAEIIEEPKKAKKTDNRED